MKKTVSKSQYVYNKKIIYNIVKETVTLNIKFGNSFTLKSVTHLRHAVKYVLTMTFLLTSSKTFDDASVDIVPKKYICTTRLFFHKLAGERLEFGFKFTNVGSRGGALGFSVLRIWPVFS